MSNSSEIADLKKELLDVKLVLQEAVIMLNQQSNENEKLRNRVKELEELLKKTQGIPPKKDSSNSNLPPSKDLPRPDRRRSLRQKSNRKSGGQPGHKGHTLDFNSDPDKTIHIFSKACQKCGSKLDLSNAELVGSRQQIDTPVVKPITTQFNIYETKCTCGCINESEFPTTINAPVQYGPRVRSLITYLSVRQYVPYNRIKELLHDCYGVSISEGTIYNTLERGVKNTKGLYETIKCFLAQSSWVGSDESGIKVNGKNWYDWVWQNKKATYIAAKPSKRKDHIYEEFYHGFPNAILSSDQYAAQLGTPAKGHQICYPHLYRRLVYLQEAEENRWLIKIKEILKKAENLKSEKAQRSRKDKKAMKLEEELNQLLLVKLDEDKNKESITFQNSFKRDRHAIFTFLYHAEVPPDNNSSEQAVRNAKVKMKISGFFKSQQQTYAQLRSVVDTLIKNNQPILPTLHNIELGIDVPLEWSHIPE